MKKIRDVFATDVDGVLADFSSCYLLALRDLFGLEYSLSDITTWLFVDSLGITEEQDAIIWRSSVLTNYMKNAKVFLSGAKMVQEAYDNGYDIVYITARGMSNLEPLQQRKARHDLTVSWIKQVGLPSGPVEFALNKLPMLQKHNAKTMVDDSPFVAMDLAKAGIKVTVPKWHYNNHLKHPNITFVDGWETKFACKSV